jgi:hypothetical protein
VPNCEIFDRLDVHDFYYKAFLDTRLSAKIYIILIWGGDVHHLISDAHADHMHRFLIRMLSVSLKVLTDHSKREARLGSCDA